MQVTSGAIGHIDLTKVWPQNFAKTLREEKGAENAFSLRRLNLYTKNDKFAKTGSGQAPEKLREKGVFCRLCDGTVWQVHEQQLRPKPSR